MISLKMRRTLVIYKPNFTIPYTKANEILVVSETITSFPFSATKLIKEFSDISICSFEWARSKGVEPTDLGSDSAFIVRIDGRSVIFFNEEHPKSRIQFSLLHEFGHFLLGHKFEKITDEEYSMQEVETNFFVAQLLMPKQIINELFNREVIIDQTFLVENFKVSKEAADKRLDHLNKVREFSYKKKEVYFDDIILKKYGNFIDGIKKPIDNFEDYYEKELERQQWY